MTKTQAERETEERQKNKELTTTHGGRELHRDISGKKPTAEPFRAIGQLLI